MSLLGAKLKNRLLRARLRGRELPQPARANLSALDHLDPRRPARSYGYAVVDLETTGMDPQQDRVVAVGAVRVVEGRVLLGDSFTELVNPGRAISVEAIKVHGITPDQVAGARPPAEVFQDFLVWLGRDVLVAHYAEFDLHFIHRTMRRLYGFPLQNLVIDTVRMCQGVVLPSDPYGIGRHRRRCALEALAQRFGLDLAERHTALGDAFLTALVFLRMLARLEQVGPGTLRDLLRVGGLD